MIHWFLLSIFIAESPITPGVFYPRLLFFSEFKTEAECLAALDKPMAFGDYNHKDQFFCIAAQAPPEGEAAKLRVPISCNGDLCQDGLFGTKDCRTGRPCKAGRSKR